MSYDRQVQIVTSDSFDHTARGGVKPHQGREWVGAREAEQILEISRAACLRLARIGELSSKLIDEPGQRRHRLMKLADVLRLRDSGTALRRPARLYRVRAVWVRLFGPIPVGFTVKPRDGNGANVEPENLALVPLRGTGRIARQRRRRRTRSAVRWTPEMRDVLRRDFATRSTDDLARELGCSALAVRQQAQRMKIRKSLNYIAQRMRAARAQPIGTERLLTSDKNKGIVLVKVTDEGTQSQQWRPKQHVVWEEANGRMVPKGFRVIFKDGNKQNFDPDNLELTTREEIFVGAMARFLSNPPPLRKAVRLNRQLQREIRRQANGHTETASSEAPARGSRKGVAVCRWTPQMVEILSRDYPTKPFPEVASAIGVTVSQMRLKASRLGIRRLPGTMVAEAAAAAAIVKQQALG